MPEAAKDPLVSAFFSLTIDGKLTGAFKEVTNLGSENQVVEHKASGPNGQYVIKKHDTSGKPVAQWNLLNCWPSKLTGPAGKADANEVAVEELVLTHEGYERVQ